MFDEFKIKFNEPVYHTEVYERWGQTYPPDFFNRRDQKNAALPYLQRLDVRRAVLVLGERRSGKTSMLKFLVEQLKKEGLPVIDIQSQGIQNANEFFQELMEGIDAWRQQQSPSAHVIAPGNAKTISQLQVMQALKEIFETNRENTGAPNPVLIWIDELDTIIEHGAIASADKEKIVGFLAKLIESADFPAKVLFSITHEFPESSEVRSSPLLTKALQIKMTPFPEEDARAMVRAMTRDGVDWEAITAALDWRRFCNLTGCWPYYMKLLLMHLAQTPFSSPAAWLDDALQSALADETLRMTLEHVYKRHFDDDERAVLLWMTRSGGALSAPSLRDAEAPLLAAANRLADRHYLKKEDGRFTFQVGLLKHWLQAWPESEEDWKHKYRQRTVSLT